MGILVLVVVAALAAAAVVTVLVRAGPREAQAERVRLADEAQKQARRWLETIWAMNDRAFEEYVAGLCRRDGCTRVQRVGGAGDLGADVIGYLPDDRKTVIQCKRYAKHRSVGSRDIQTFNGTARAEHGADVPVFVASCVFTKQARAFRHTTTSNILDVTDNDSWVAEEAGNWASVQTVEEVYGHPDMHSAEFVSALKSVWGEPE